MPIKQKRRIFMPLAKCCFPNLAPFFFFFLAVQVSVSFSRQLCCLTQDLSFWFSFPLWLDYSWYNVKSTSLCGSWPRQSGDQPTRNITIATTSFTGVLAYHSCEREWANSTAGVNRHSGAILTYSSWEADAYHSLAKTIAVTLWFLYRFPTSYSHTEWKAVLGSSWCTVNCWIFWFLEYLFYIYKRNTLPVTIN